MEMFGFGHVTAPQNSCGKFVGQLPPEVMIYNRDTKFSRKHEKLAANDCYCNKIYKLRYSRFI